MNLNDESLHIAHLITKSRHAVLSDEEQQLLANWAVRSMANRQLMEELRQNSAIGEQLSYCYQQKEKTAFSWQKIEGKLSSPFVPFKKRFFPLRTIAASLLILIGLSFYLYSTYKTSQKDTSSSPLYRGQDASAIAPGSSKGTLILSNGEEVKLGDKSATIQDLSGMSISATAGELDYRSQKKALKKAENLYNTLVVPKTGIYNLMLSDGTKVWLNANSSLKFPLQFSKKHRTVYLHGEAFFEVQPNPSQPFTVVMNPNYTVQALGTSFNINSYSSDIRTILTAGKLRVSYATDSITLAPQQQATIQNGKLSKKQADIEEATAWKDGYFYFNDRSINAIMEEIARWYAIEVSIDKDIPLKRYSGSISRNVKLAEVLLMLNKVSRLDYHLKDGVVTVSTNPKTPTAYGKKQY